ncbi:galactosyltransferase-related protein [uncultured Maritimibacter sp.]|uniref:glycosyltransferase n=1 Tax=uncultured Maritimibacter sp. TaxID=991866 RepID=UPI00259AC9E8|nr:galactosyltransferase-related protein [uncultured Maritimibacter sp.]
MDILNILTRVRSRGAAFNISGLRLLDDTETQPREARTPAQPQTVTTPLPRIRPEGRPGISLVSCVRNRIDNLSEAVKTWIALDELDEILIVDWSSDEPVARALARRRIRDKRLRIVRVEGEDKWTLSYAYNVGFRLSRHDRIVKADADIQIEREFFARNPLPDKGFVAGNWRRVPEDQAHTNGFFYIDRAHLARVGGFNEFITSYGWDDDDLYRRLDEGGLTRIDVDPITIHHLPHGDAERLDRDHAPAGDTALDQIRHDPHFGIRRNQHLVELMPTWRSHLAPLPMSHTVASDGTETLERRAPHPNAVPPFVNQRVDDSALRVMASWRFGQGVLGLNETALTRLLARPAASITAETVSEALAVQEAALRDNPSPAYVPHRTRLFIDTQHGLGNRLRAMASAATIADATGRELVVVWHPDHHCEARLTDLFDYDGAVIEDSFIDDATRLGAHVYNYMEIEEGAEKNVPVDLKWSGDIYARSAFVLNCEVANWEAENAFLRAMTPAAHVRDLVAGVRAPNDVSVHVRMVGGAKDAHLSYESGEEWNAESQATIGFWRKKSHFSAFLKRVEALRAEGEADRIFVAADSPEAYRAFTDTFGEKVAYLHRDLYDRSPDQLAYALADAILLGRAPRLLGSTWSSFTELALRLAPARPVQEMSGKDF